MPNWLQGRIGQVEGYLWRTFESDEDERYVRVDPSRSSSDAYVPRAQWESAHPGWTRRSDGDYDSPDGQFVHGTMSGQVRVNETAWMDAHPGWTSNGNGTFRSADGYATFNPVSGATSFDCSRWETNNPEYTRGVNAVGDTVYYAASSQYAWYNPMNGSRGMDTDRFIADNPGWVSSTNSDGTVQLRNASGTRGVNTRTGREYNVVSGSDIDSILATRRRAATPESSDRASSILGAGSSLGVLRQGTSASSVLRAPSKSSREILLSSMSPKFRKALGA